MVRPLLKLVQVNKPEQTFPVVWTPYPRHEAKKDGFEAWRSLDPDAALLAEILAAIAWQAHLWVVIERRQQRHIPLFGTYIRGERWTDEPPAANQTPMPSQNTELPDWKRRALFHIRREP